MKMAAFSFISKAFSKFGCCKFENGVLGSFSELVYASFFVFQYIKRVRISPKSQGYFFIINQIRNQLTRKIVDFDDNNVVVLYHYFNKSSE